MQKALLFRRIPNKILETFIIDKVIFVSLFTLTILETKSILMFPKLRIES